MEASLKLWALRTGLTLLLKVLVLQMALTPSSGLTNSSLPHIKDVDKFVKAMPKVELHIHLDGAMSPSTLWDLAKEKSFPFKAPLPDYVKNAQDFSDFLEMRDNGNLPEFLKKFDFMLPQVSGDAAALRRVARDLCKTKAGEGVVYFETRYAPQFLTDPPPDDNATPLTLEQVVEAVNAGLAEGSARFNVTAKSILSCMRVPDFGRYSMELARLAEKHRPNGVVGIDLAGDESTIDYPTRPDDSRHVDAFQFAFEKGVHRTVHAGEVGPASNVGAAMDKLHAERIGHGYRVLEDDAVYDALKKGGVHLEECPYSSVKTGAFDVARFGWRRHPVRRFFEDGASFSVNTDDPTVTGRGLVDDYRVVVAATASDKVSGGVGLPIQALVDSVRNAVKAAFVDGEEKEELRKKVEEKLEEAVELANRPFHRVYD